MATDGDPERSEIGYLARLLLWIIGIALVALVAAATERTIAVVGVGCLIFVAAFASGAGIGFIFSVPRAAGPTPAATGPGAPTPPTSPPTGAAAAKSASVRERLLNSNSSLSQISDWLATMLVGVGLIQLHKLNDLLIEFRDFLHDFGPKGAVLPAIGPMILIFGAVAGFLFMYVYTRLVLTNDFDKSERILQGVEDVPLSRVAASGVQQVAAEAVQTASAARGLPGQTGNVLPGSLASRAAASALQESASKPVRTVGEALTVMYGLLYQPGGYQSVIELRRELDPGPATNSAEFWFYLAAAYGQQHFNLPLGDVAGRDAARRNALEAARQAVALDPGMASRLWYISTPKSEDNDLQDFRTDPEFLRIVGRAS